MSNLTRIAVSSFGLASSAYVLVQGTPTKLERACLKGILSRTSLCWNHPSLLFHHTMHVRKYYQSTFNHVMHVELPPTMASLRIIPFSISGLHEVNVSVTQGLLGC